ncbi:MAG: septum formation initiator family protein [Chloroflexota bacterium]|nr:septum formation initiator family protein [Chloroflexota bacterium]
MTVEASVSARAPNPKRVDRRLRLPASRGGLTWLVVLLLVGAFLAVQLGRQIYINWAISRQADEMRAEIAAVAAENDALQRELDYLRSHAYVSQEARRLSNLGAAGEQALIIPPGAEAAVPANARTASDASRPLLEQWLDLFFGR